MENYQKTLGTANGRITCLRCTAMSKRSRLQCGRPAMKLSKGQKCNFHGGKSTGPRTVAGRQRISKAHLVHGNETVQMRLERQQKNAYFAHIEDVMHVVDMMTLGVALEAQNPAGIDLSVHLTTCCSGCLTTH